MTCLIDNEHLPHSYPSAVFPTINVHCTGSAAGRCHFLTMVGSIKCSCGWQVGKGVGAWSWVQERVTRHIADHPDGDFGDAA